MASLLIIVFFGLPLTYGGAWLLAKRRDQGFVFCAILVAWLIGSLILTVMNGWMPFAEGHDDRAYFRFASIPAITFLDALDLNRYAGLLEQPGYPAFLSAIAFWIGPDLLALKYSNFSIYILTCLVWYRIAVEFNSRLFARYMLGATLLLTPLWYYVFFLLKDMVIVFLQSVFLLGLVVIWKKASLWGLVTVLLSTATLILLRSPLIIQHLGLVVILAVFKLFSSGGIRKKIIILAFSLFAVLVVLRVATNPEILMSLGIVSDSRVVDAETALEVAEYHQERSKIQWKLFPILYILVETSGLSPTSWERMDHQWVRGVLTLTWIFAVIPFVALGALWLASIDATKPFVWTKKRWVSKSIFRTPWVILLGYMLSYVVISYSVGDTTRWRVPDMPAYLMVGVAGWLYAARAERWWILFLWFTGIGALLGIFYFTAEIL